MAVGDLQAAMQLNASDGAPDRIHLAVGTFVGSDEFTPTGTDQLSVVGSGAQTRLTSAGAGFPVVVLGIGQRPVALSDLSVIIPAAFPDGQGYGVAVNSWTLRDVDIISENPGSIALQAGNAAVYEGGSIHSQDAGSLDVGVWVVGQTPTAPTLKNAKITADSGVWVSGTGGLSLSASRLNAVDGSGVVAMGGEVDVKNTQIITAADYSVFALDAAVDGDQSASITADHVSMRDNSAIDQAVVGASVAGNAATANASVSVSNSTADGYESAYFRSAPGGEPALGNASVSMDYSSIPAPGYQFGDGSLALGPGNIDADPLLGSPDLSLLAGSPAVDSAAPNDATTTDIAGHPRGIDGDGDGIARSDQGAYELDEAAPKTEILSGPEDQSVISRPTATFAFQSSEPGSAFECRLDDEPFSACSSPVDYLALIEGPHVFSVRATDSAGNTDQSPATRRFAVRLATEDLAGQPDLCPLRAESPKSSGCPTHVDPYPVGGPDKTPPNTTITKASRKKSKKTKAKIAFVSTEPNSTFTCKLDKRPAKACSSPYRPKRLKAGKHRFSVYATDAAGNVDQTPAVVKWKVRRR